MVVLKRHNLSHDCPRSFRGERRQGEVPAYVVIELHVHHAGHDRTLVSAVLLPLVFSTEELGPSCIDLRMSNQRSWAPGNCTGASHASASIALALYPDLQLISGIQLRRAAIDRHSHDAPFGERERERERERLDRGP